MTNIDILTHQAVQSIDCKMRDQHEIDWEQRRYEIAKECLPTVYQTALEIAKKTERHRCCCSRPCRLAD